MTLFKNLGLLILVFFLGACGFHLRGVGDGALKPLTFKTLALDNSTRLAGSLDKVFRRDKRITIVKSPQDADMVLKVYDEYTQRDISLISRGGNVNEYLLVLSVKAQLFRDGISYSDPMQMTVRRTYTYSDNQVLGKQDEEAELWDDMRTDIAEQVLRRLSYITPKASSVEKPEVKSPEKAVK